jgi:uncharacterized protein YecE (DUF72 family)
MATPQDKRAGISRVHIGTMGWSYRFWTGRLYPERLRPKEFLTEYARHFNSVELDNTFYRIPSSSTVKTWKEQTPEGFKFSAKFPRVITHVKKLQNCEKEVDRFISSMSQLQTKLGPLLFQFPGIFGLKQLPLLQEFLPSLPTSCHYAVEVRNRNILVEKLYSVLRENKVAFALTGQTGVSFEEVTADFAYVRWEGDRRVSGTLGKTEVDRTEDTKKWAERIAGLLGHGFEVFGYFSKYYSGYPPSDAEQFLKLLSLQYGLGNSSAHAGLG